MENTWMIVAFILLIVLIIFILYHIYYRMNIKHITKQLEEIINIKDTNQLLTVLARQKDITSLVNMINNQLNDIRLSSIQIKRLNKNFRDTITNMSSSYNQAEQKLVNNFCARSSLFFGLSPP